MDSSVRRCSPPARKLGQPPHPLFRGDAARTKASDNAVHAAHGRLDEFLPRATLDQPRKTAKRQTAPLPGLLRMNTQINSWARFRKAATLQIDLPTLVPLTVVTCAAPVTLTVWERYGTVAVYFVLVGWCGVLFGSAAWLNYALFRRSSTFRPFLVAIVGILSIWF